MAAEAKITAKIGGDSSQLESKLNATKNSVRDWAQKVEGSTSNLFKTPHLNLMHLSRGLMTAFSIGGAVEFFKGIIQKSEEAGASSIKMADKLGVTLEKYDQWKEKAEAMRMPLDDLAKLVERIQKAHGGATDVDRILGTGGEPSASDTWQANVEKDLDARKAGGNTFWQTQGRGARMVGAAIGDFFSGDWDRATDMLNGEQSAESAQQEGWRQHVKDISNRLIKHLEDKEAAEKKSAQDYERWQQQLEHIYDEAVKARADHEKRLREADEKKEAAAMKAADKAIEDAREEYVKQRNELIASGHRFDESVSRIRVPGTDAQGLGAIGGYSGAHMDNGKMAASQRASIIDALRKIEQNTEN